MPKGKTTYLASLGFSFTCSIKEIKREFTTEKDRDNYKKRHQKMCRCANEQGINGITTHLNGKSNVVVNDMSKKMVDEKLYTLTEVC